MEKLKNGIVKYATGIEIILAIFVLAGITLGLLSIIRYLFLIYDASSTDIYATMKNFLGVTLLLVIGVELVLMLLSHSSMGVLELVLFAIARKMLVYSDTMLELLIATIAIAIVFAIKKYLVESKYAFKEGKVLSAAAPVKSINFDVDCDFPENKGKTIGGLICKLSEEQGIPIKEGQEFKYKNNSFRIVSIEDGVINDVYIKTK